MNQERQDEPNVQFSNKAAVQTNFVRVNKAINFIERNLDKDLSLRVLAETTNYSPFHFHRIFKTICGETPHDFVIRKRVEKIAWVMMKQKNLPIKQLAYSYGFDSAVSFSKAFKKYYGTSASSLRKKSQSDFNVLVKQNSKIGKEPVSVEKYFSNTDKVRKWMFANAQVSTENLEPRRLAYVRSRGSFDLVDISFAKLRKWAAKRNLLDDDSEKWLLIIHDNPAITDPDQVGHSACLELKDGMAFGEEIGQQTIPAGRFLVGCFEIMDHEFQLAWSGMSIWLLENGFSYRDGDYFEEFETNSVFEEGAKHKVKIHIPIE